MEDDLGLLKNREAQMRAELDNHVFRIKQLEQDALAKQQATLAETKKALEQERATFAQEKAAFAQEKEVFAQEREEFARAREAFGQEKAAFVHEKQAFAEGKGACAEARPNRHLSLWKKLNDDILPNISDLAAYWRNPGSVERYANDDEAYVDAERILALLQRAFMRWDQDVPTRDYRHLILNVMDRLFEAIPMTTGTVAELAERKHAFLPMQEVVWDQWTMWSRWRKNEQNEKKWRDYLTLKNSKGGKLKEEEIVRFDISGDGFDKHMDLIAATKWRSPDDKEEFNQHIRKSILRQGTEEKEWIDLD